ncbi:MAG: hypothetical protein B7Y25_00615 [Alphaproteobacteria bacterium 16-39-46]|nr:MAG: hypothetical protein B7Y25_00615 [Alphaproteobacteria bacterium 16-39-46]OZA44342.1 MAG: hypothetical protein B7X84_00620 [Alphaproteobacteria bacterium 17-39-52]HQS83412.1 glucose-6-phosphate isomerase [Alphaproteobacteria bacterium]HQS93176.1 glucose-6-phosphate isomerase [Alphaproteobacteria bacterium]
MIYQDISGLFQTGKEHVGLHKIDLERSILQVSRVSEKLRENIVQNAYPFLTSVQETEDIKRLLPVLKRFSENLETIIVLGTGGSSLGGQTVTALRDGGVGFHFSKPSLYFLENIDPFTLNLLINHVDLEKTGLLVISKSGTTSETLAQVLTCEKLWAQKNLSPFFIKNTLVVTEAKSSPLRRFAQYLGILCLDHDPKVGGRFSVFSLVGLIPLMCANLDPLKLRRGGYQVLEKFLTKSITESTPALGAAALYALMMERGITQTVLMPYVDRLAPFGLWFRQLWAESLGKDGIGQTPIRAMGTVDQHSQLQLYLDGPKDKVFTLLGLEGKTAFEDKALLSSKDPELDYLDEMSLGSLLKAEEHATFQSLLQKGCPVRRLSFNRLDEEVLGELFMHFMLETLLMGTLLKIDPLTQPAVEEIKRLTKVYLTEAKKVK